MARTYSQLRDKVLILCDQTNSDDATAVVQIALEETLKYIAAQVELPQLLSSKTATWGALTTGLSIASDFVATDYASPDRLYVKKDVDAEDYGTPYDYLEFMHWNDLRSCSSGGIRESIYEVNRVDERPAHAWTIDLSNNVIIDPVTEGNVATLFYLKEPDAYADGAFPQMPPKWDYILVSGATLILKEWMREGDVVIDPQTILTAIDPQIAKMDMEMNSKRQRANLKISHRYRIR